MKKKLFEHVSGNQFRVCEDFDWSKDKPHEAEKKFDVDVNGKKYTYSVTAMPDGDLHHYIEDQNGSLVSLAPEANPRELLTPEQVQAEVQKFLANPPVPPADVNKLIAKTLSRRDADAI